MYKVVQTSEIMCNLPFLCRNSFGVHYSCTVRLELWHVQLTRPEGIQNKVAFIDYVLNIFYRLTMLHGHCSLLCVPRGPCMCPESNPLTNDKMYRSQTLNRCTLRSEYGVQEQLTSSFSTSAIEDIVRLWSTFSNEPPTLHWGWNVRVSIVFFVIFKRRSRFFLRRKMWNNSKPVQTRSFQHLLRRIQVVLWFLRVVSTP